jgi:uroporphyrinogen decarboxylase
MNPDFNNFLKVFSHSPLEKPVLFEFFLNEKLYGYLARADMAQQDNNPDKLKIVVTAFKNAGYDYATIPSSYTETLAFQKEETDQIETKSLNEGFIITNRDEFNNYDWPDPDNGNYNIFNELEKDLDPNMKLIACGPGGVLENVIELVGFERLCCMTLEDPEFAQDIFDAVGSRLTRYYEIQDMKYDGKHSYEDEIISVEDAYEKWGDRIAILGGIDLDFLVRSSKKDIFFRAKKLLELTHEKGGYALGSGNSIPEYVPNDNYFAMLSAAGVQISC